MRWRSPVGQFARPDTRGVQLVPSAPRSEEIVLKVTTWIGLAIVVLVLGFFLDAVQVSVQRSRQKRTMADMHRIAERLEKGQHVESARDAWGRPMRIRRHGPHYSIHAAGSDGVFETRSVPTVRRPRTTSTFREDLIVLDGLFVQYPEGVCLGDEAGKGTFGDCASCHPSRVAKRAS